ncbi:MAG: sugar transferase [Synergistaceae bacterium]|jgi:lipopolysaccharide/colanic/teichoic acid biosynthesis glycosyltransferase|nr:sugar transferase [Synergistaceae bacterium]
MLYSSAKRAMDLAGATVGLILFMPLMLWIAVRIRREMSPPAIFSQTRSGAHGRPFKLYKFRTMTDERDERGDLLPDVDRITKFGQWLRSTSLDELPQLWNVLRCEMSLVGPRPLLMNYVPLYSVEQRRRLDVLPGITGWAQINGRNAISWPEKFALDVWYVDNRSIALDIGIIWRTIQTAFRREGISAAGEATMPPFRGER